MHLRAFCKAVFFAWEIDNKLVIVQRSDPSVFECHFYWQGIPLDNVTALFKSLPEGKNREYVQACGRACIARVCQYAKIFLIRSSTLGKVNKRILRYLAFLFFQILFIFPFFSARKDWQKYIYFQHLHLDLVKIRHMISTEKISFCLFL